MKKALWFDVETTGLSPYKNDIIQIAGLVEINGEIKEEFEMKCAPQDFTQLDSKALAIHGYSKEMLKEFPAPREIYNKLIRIIEKYISRYDKNDKFTPAGYNVKFDCDFLKNFFEKAGDRYYGSLFNWKLVDPLAKLYMMDYEMKLSLPDYKLSTVCAHFNIPLKAHDALADIKATRELYQILTKV